MAEIANMTKEQLKEELAKAQAELEASKRAAEVTGEDPKRRVKIKLFKDNGKYKEPLLVSVNDYTALIKRGVMVEVPYYVAMHIHEIEEQDAKTAMMISGLAEAYAEKAKNM